MRFSTKIEPALAVVKNLTRTGDSSVGVEIVPGNVSRSFVTLPSEEDDRIVTVYDIVDNERKRS